VRGGILGLFGILLGALAACTPGAPAEQPGLGVRVLEGPVRDVRASSSGDHLAVLTSCNEARGQYLPPRTASCELRVVPAAGGPSARVAQAVTTLPHGLAWSPAGDALAALADYDYPAAAGALVRWQGGRVEQLAEGVTFHGFAPDGRLGLVAGGALLVAPPDAAPAQVEGASAVATFEFAPAPVPGSPELLARRRGAEGGELLAVAGGRARPLAAGAADYAFAPGAARFAFTRASRGGAELVVAPASATALPAPLARGATQFAFSRDGAALAWISDVVPGRQGNLHVAELSRPGARPARLAEEVGELRWAARAPVLAWLERYDPRVRAGRLGVGGPGLAARRLGANVSEFELAPDGSAVAYLQHTTRGGYSVDLGLVRPGEPAGAAAPAPVAQGVFGFAFSPDGRWLYYRTRCVRNGEACDLERVPARGLAPGEKPEPVAPGVKSFEFDPRDPERLLLGFQRMDLPALDVAVWAGGALTAVDQAVVPGTARFLGPDSRRLAYAVLKPGREGVYVATLPGAGAPRAPER
jgi:hypothetical protein